VELWMVGLALSALLVVAARDVGRPGRASAAGLAGLRAVGGTGLAAMALLAIASGHPIAAAVGALGAAPLLGGLVAPLLRRRLARTVAPARAGATLTGTRYAAPAEERRAA
jgi:hypothetical protein